MRLLLLEDHLALSDAIASHLRAHGFVVEAFSTVKQAEGALATAEFGAALIDLSLPDGNGLDLVIRLRRQGGLLPIIIMTARDQIRDRIRGLEAGADDYLVKPFDLDELLARIHAVSRRYEGNPSTVQSFGHFDVDRNSHRVSVRGEDIPLTAKEWALLEKLVSRPGTVFSKEQLEQSIYRFDDDTESNTLEVFISRLRKKLGKDTIETIRGLGYRLNVPQK
jgi:two-component system OmpR family response regulator